MAGRENSGELKCENKKEAVIDSLFANNTFPKVDLFLVYGI
jgi:hypothetical protein